VTNSDSTTKICRDCHCRLSLNCFPQQRGCKGGLRPECKGCQKRYRRAYYVQNQKRLQKYSRDFYAKYKDHFLNYQKAYANLNSERVSKRLKAWQSKNRTKLLEGKRDYYYANKARCNERSRTYRQQNLVRLAAKRKEYEFANPDIVRFHKMQHETRKRNAFGECTSEQWKQKCEYHGCCCIYCQVSLTPKTMTIEHRKPLSRGGSNHLANLAPACKSCNQSKNKKSEAEFRLYLKTISA
jgi:5-methylcytosine-specific restriction endonuclease McrA